MLLSDKDNERLNTKPTVIIETEDERLRKDIYRSDKEKFLLFTQMLRRNALFKKAKITHKASINWEDIKKIREEE